MALLLAPYNEAMRLGMGFNSFTQQLCINDAVKSQNGNLANEQSLRPQYKKGNMTNADGTDVHIVQEVTWTAKFVDRLSEVTDSLNVSGSLQIKCDAIGGGGSASASFVDTNKFKESDINYLIQVRVTNQRLVAPDLTVFDPIPNLPDAEFTRVYGDSYISGFTEGGEFNALVSIKLKDHTKAREIRGQLQVDLDFKAAQVSGSAALEKVDSSKNIDGETTISVSWRGGGDIKDESVSDWTLETLKAVAMEFPEHVMSCPLRTNAILTKYTGLKSFYSKLIQGTPLDYENAGVYSSALLDAYMDYKIMWRNIQTAVWEVEQGQSELIAKKDLPEFAETSLEAKANYQNALNHYKERLLAYEHRTKFRAAAPAPEALPPPPDEEASELEETQAVVAAPAPVATTTTTTDLIPSHSSGPPQPPMPPNDLVPYKPNIFGLDKARRDCRFEMIKIVREVDAVADDPKIACDPARGWQYLSPAIFRMLLPTIKNLDKEKLAQLAAEEAQAAKDASTKAQEELKGNLSSIQRKLEATEESVRALENSKRDIEAKLQASQAVQRELCPYDGWCPVPVGTEVRFRNFNTKKAIDIDWSDGRGGLGFHQWDPYMGANQRFVIEKAGPIGFRVRHPDSNRYWSTGNVGANGRVYMVLSEFATLFTFENLNDGTCNIHLAEQTNYTMNPENGTAANNVQFILWPHGAGINDKWIVKPYNDLS